MSKSNPYLSPMFGNKTDIFFDLDHTIWDFDRNAKETLRDLYTKYGFEELFPASNPDEFVSAYTTNNHRLWSLYHQGKIDKATLRKRRFEDTFVQLGAAAHLFPPMFEEEYLAICPTKTHLFPHAHETLSYLGEKYHLHLISNGFREACETKIASSRLEGYFKTITISEVFGVNKPDPRIFAHAVDRGGTEKHRSVMIGDNIEADVRGALRFGMDAIFFNPHAVSTPADIDHSITCLSDLQRLF